MPAERRRNKREVPFTHDEKRIAGVSSCLLFALFRHYLHYPDSLITYLIVKNIVCNTYINIQHIQVIRLYISVYAINVIVTVWFSLIMINITY